MSVVTNKVGDLTLITMDDGKVNAVNPALIQELDEGLDEGMQGRGVLFVGREKVFSAGLDLKLVEQGNLDGAREFLRLFNAFLRRLILYPRPMVAAVNGHAIGAGAIFAVARPPAIHSHRAAFCVDRSSVVVIIARYYKSLCFWNVNVHWVRAEEPDVAPVFQKPVSRS